MRRNRIRRILSCALFAGFAGTSAACGTPSDRAPVGQGVKSPEQALYDYHCATCHGAGPGNPGTAALAFRYKGTDVPAVLAERTDLTPEVVAYFVRNGVNAMPFFRKTEISDAELTQIGDYLSPDSED